MGTGKDGAFDYSDFVHIFLNSFVSNLRQCLQEWLIQATASSADTSSLAKVDTSLDALSGEVVAFAPTERVHWCVMGGKHSKHPQHIPGVMYATNYRIVLFALR
jgi:UDP-2,3-diacylglucosamine pyrophosphatase LpxH